MLTTRQFREQTKTVTRRKGWKFVKVGDVLMGCEKCQGLGKGGRVNRLGQIRVKSVRYEQLAVMLVEPYGSTEARLEGFPELDGAGFVNMFCEHMQCDESEAVTRIEYEYL